MSTPLPTACEVKIDGQWRAVTVSEAHARHRDTDKRCPSCHGKVMVHGAYTFPFKLGLSHRKNHRGCTLAERGICVAQSSLSRFFKRHGITRKKTQATPPSRIGRP